ncbi:MAG: 16S rRNA (uracil(1498)-N(3))-methyltransferase [Planctomycetes bacterium]|nr:16S rRNA (uracil(1498)-N(3))-methyltransferase [Planctomycetota bacterium]
MHRFYCPNLAKITLPVSGNAILSEGRDAVVTLDADETHHARKVLRLQPGETVDLIDGQGRSGVAELTGYADGHALLKLRQLRHIPPPVPSIDVAVTLPKGPRADDMVNALSQLGVATLIPLRSERSTVDPRAARLDRYHRAAIESAKQSGRAHFMRITETHEFADALKLTHDVKLIAHPTGEPAADVTAKVAGAKSVVVLIGPEGGWTDGELDAARGAGCRAWRFARDILRIETAAVAAAAILGAAQV